MFTLVAALQSELQPVLQKEKILSRITLYSGMLYITQGMHVLRLGLGRKRAVQSLKAYLTEFDSPFLLHIGFAGQLSEKLLPPCAVFVVEAVHSPHASQALALPCLPEFEHLPKATLLTADAPVEREDEKRQWRAQFKAELVDMETYDLAALCREKNVPLFVLKSVTDRANEMTNREFKQKYRQCALKLAEVVENVLQMGTSWRNIKR